MVGSDDKVVMVGYEEVSSFSIDEKPLLTYTLAEKSSVQVRLCFIEQNIDLSIWTNSNGVFLFIT